MDTAQILSDLRAQRDRINQAISALDALGGIAATPRIANTATEVNGLKIAPVAASSGKKRVVGPEARQRMAEAQQKRWATKKRATKAAAKKAAAVTPVATTSTKDAGKPTAAKKAKGGLTAAGRKRLSEATKARWAAKNAATAKA